MGRIAEFSNGPVRVERSSETTLAGTAGRKAAMRKVLAAAHPVRVDCARLEEILAKPVAATGSSGLEGVMV